MLYHFRNGRGPVPVTGATHTCRAQPWQLPGNGTLLPAGIYPHGPDHLKVGQQADGIAPGSSVIPNCAVM